MLTIKNLNKVLHNKKIIHDISLDIKRGSIVVLLGPSGVGKSTFIRMLNNLETIDSGEFYLDEKPVTPALLNKEHRIGMVFQQFNLFEHLTVLQNITLALEKVASKTKKEAQHHAQQLLAHYDLTDKMHKYPAQLSGGQKQRLAIARTIALEPIIICFDEPTSALDPLLTTHIANTIQELARLGYIVIVASHDISLLEKLDCMIYLMHNGTIIETASSHDFKQHKNNYPRINAFVSGISASK